MIIASVYPFPFHIGLGHDANVAILSPTQVFSYEEGKLSGDVMPCFPGFPQRALAAGFRQHAIGPKDVDHWVFGRPFRTDVDHSLTHFFHHLKLPSSHLEALRAQGRLHFVDHHTGHAALAVHGSGFERGSFLTYDGGGDEFQPCVMSHGTFADGILQVEGLSPSESPGIANLYDCLAAATGFIAPVETGKFMGLAGYGRADPELYSKLQSLLEDTPLGRRYALSKIRRDKYTPYRFDRYDCDTYNYFKVYYSPVAPAAVEACTRFHSAPDVAATAQCLLQETMLRIVEQVVPKGGTTDLVLAGGLFQNIVLNDAIAQQSRAARVYVPMAPSDGGLSLGAALTVERRLGVSRQRFLMSPFLGPAFTESQIEAAFSKNHIAYSKPKSIVHTAADLIAEGNIIGWFQGRAELGPRALGARSILVHALCARNLGRVHTRLPRITPWESLHVILLSNSGGTTIRSSGRSPRRRHV